MRAVIAAMEKRMVKVILIRKRWAGVSVLRLGLIT
jgi:hypothetical protein